MARDKRIDSIKGLLIVLVILGHVITTLDNVNRINHAVMGLIYIFHMPLFILISGYLTKNPSEQSARDMWSGVGSIAITLAIFQLLENHERFSLWGSLVHLVPGLLAHHALLHAVGIAQTARLVSGTGIDCDVSVGIHATGQFHGDAALSQLLFLLPVRILLQAGSHISTLVEG